jgi:hypothetical protein
MTPALKGLSRQNALDYEWHSMIEHNTEKSRSSDDFKSYSITLKILDLQLFRGTATRLTLCVLLDFDHTLELL